MWYNTQTSEVLARLNVDKECGLSDSEVESRRLRYGKNVLEEKQKKGLWRRFAEQFADYMVVILLIAAGISFVMSLIDGSGDFFDPIIILLIVVLNATIGVIQESKAEKALDALKELSSPTVKVKRGGQVQAVHSDELVIGDIIFLETGDFVPADARLLDSVALKTDESALTGESEPVTKDHAAKFHGEADIGDVANMVWATTVVTGGRATAVVVETGMNTQVGKIARMIISSETPQTPLQNKLANTGKTLGLTALIICAVIFIMGLLRHMPSFDMFMTSISLAVAAIPEGLPAIVTIMLALGVQKMVRRNAIVRKLPAVETLGSATVICSDKTGTLTQNKMTVTEVHGDEAFVLELASLCNNDADPTEHALVCAFEQGGKDAGALAREYQRVQEIPFDSKRKMMTTIHKIPGGFRIITKGAPDVLMDKCRMSMEAKQQALRENTQMAQKALRVIAVAYTDVDIIPKEPEHNLTFVGLVGIIDPPRAEVEDAVKTCKNAGIKVVMITGDHVQTAIAVAKQIGIFTTESKAMTGSELSAISDDELAKCIDCYSVFARVTPEHKVRIVRALQRRGEVVAMTGDGVNDAPALQSADIGCAMGISGTGVAKGAADMILTDDNFATIVSAVREGRGIYANIRKAIHFLLSSNIGEIITIFMAIFFGWASPLVAIQLLWVNLVTDSLPAIALGVERPDKDIMNHQPIDRRKGLFADGLGFSIFVEGAMIGTLALLAFTIGNSIYGDLTVARTMAFAVLSLSQLVHAYNMRSDGSVFKAGIFKNKYMNLSFLVCALLQISVISIAPIAAIFKVVGLSSIQWLVVAALSIFPLIVIEVEKAFCSSEGGKQSKKADKRQNSSCQN